MLARVRFHWGQGVDSFSPPSSRVLLLDSCKLTAYNIDVPRRVSAIGSSVTAPPARTPSRFGKYLCRLRTARDLSVLTVARQVGCSRQFIHDLERGVRRTSDIETWLRLAAVLRCDPVALVLDAWQLNGVLTVPATPRTLRQVQSLVASLLTGETLQETRLE